MPRSQVHGYTRINHKTGRPERVSGYERTFAGAAAEGIGSGLNAIWRGGLWAFAVIRDLGHELRPMFGDVASTLRTPTPERERRLVSQQLDAMLDELEQKDDWSLEDIDAWEKLRALKSEREDEDLEKALQDELARAAAKRSPESRAQIAKRARLGKRRIEMKFPEVDLRAEARRLWGNGFRDLDAMASAPLLPSAERLPWTPRGELYASWGMCDLMEVVFSAADQLTEVSPEDITARLG